MVFSIGLLIFVVSFFFSMLGMGGGLLYVPIFHWVGLDLKSVATPLGLLLNGITTLLALIPYGRKGLVDWLGGLPMAIAAVLLAPVGGYLANRIPEHVLLVAFAVAVLVAAGRTLLVANRPEPEAKLPLWHRIWIGSLVAGIAGFVAGALGIGGGFIVGPLLMWLGYRTKQAVATTAFIAAASSLSGMLGHLGHMKLPIDLTIVTTGAVLIAALLGSWFMANRAKPQWVKWFYGLLLLGVAGKLLY